MYSPQTGKGIRVARFSEHVRVTVSSPSDMLSLVTLVCNQDTIQEPTAVISFWYRQNVILQPYKLSHLAVKFS